MNEIHPHISSLVGPTIFTILGLLIIIGTYKKYELLVPPDDFPYKTLSHVKLKKLFGEKFIIAFNYLLGTIFLFFGAKAIWNQIQILF